MLADQLREGRTLGIVEVDLGHTADSASRSDQKRDPAPAQSVVEMSV